MSQLTAILITGTRDRSAEHHEGLAKEVAALMSGEPPPLLIVGNDLERARGVDRVAIQMWQDAGYPRVPMPAPWDEWRRQGRDFKMAGSARNSMMLGVAKRLTYCLYDVECHAFPGPKSAGTWDMHSKAKKESRIRTVLHRTLLGR